MDDMQPKVPGMASRFEGQLDGLREHRTLGGLVRLYFRRREQILYLVVGGWNTVFGYAVWALLQFLLGEHLHYLVIVVLAWPIAVLNAYLGYRLIVFRSNASILRELPRFSLVYVAGLIIGLLALPVLLNVLPFNIYVVQALLTGAVIIGSYVSHRYYSFAGGPRGGTPGAPTANPAIVAED